MSNIGPRSQTRPEKWVQSGPVDGFAKCAKYRKVIMNFWTAIPGVRMRGEEGKSTKESKKYSIIDVATLHNNKQETGVF